MYTHTHTLFTKRAEEEGCEEREYREASDWRERGVMEGTRASYEERGRYPYDDGHENGDHRFGEREPYGSRDKSHDQDRERSRQHRDDKDRERNRSERSDKENDRERHKSREKSREPERSRDRERHRDYERERRYKHRTHSPSRGRSRGHSRSRSPSQSSSHERRSKRTSGFDMAPPGLAAVPGVTVPGAAGATQAISSVFPGMFPFMGTQFGAMSTMPMQAMTQQATRHARRVYVGGLPPQANEHMIATFFSSVMSAIGGNTAGPGDAVVNVYINHEKKFAFVEMRSVEEASNAMALDGVMFEGVSVRVRRPSDYNPSLAATLGPSQPCSHLNLAAVGLTPGSAIGGADGPDRVFVGGLPYYLTEAQIKELLESFGSLRGFDLVKDRETGNSKGYAFCVYQEPAATDVACAALNGLKMGDKTLTVRRATASGQPKPDQANVLVEAQQQIAYQKLALQTSVASPLGFPGLVSGLVAGMVPAINDDIAEVPTKVICLTQVVTADELNDDDEYQDIYDDMKQECGKFGSITNLVIPRPQVTGEPVSGVGKVFVEYSDTQGSSKAKQALHGRKFGGKPVTGVFYSEHKFHNGEYDD